MKAKIEIKEMAPYESSIGVGTLVQHTQSKMIGLVIGIPKKISLELPTYKIVYLSDEPKHESVLTEWTQAFCKHWNGSITLSQNL